MADKPNEILDEFNEGLKSITGDIGNNFSDFSSTIDDMLTSMTAEVAAQQKKIGTSAFVDFTSPMAELANVINDAISDFGSFVGMEGLADFSTYIEILQETYNKLGELHNTAMKEIQNITEMAAEDIYSPFETMFSLIENIPGGKYISDAMGLNEIKENIKTKIKDSLVDSIQGGAGGFQTLASVAMGSLRAIGSGMMALLTNPFVLAAAAIGGLIAMFISAQNASKAFLKETGLGAKETEKLRAEILDISASLTKFGVSTEDGFNSAAALYNEFGNINIITKEMITTTAKLAANLGVSEETSARVLNQFMGMNNGSANVAQNWMGIIAGLSKAAGVGAGDVFKDIAQNSEFISTHLRGSTKELALTVVEAHRLGMNLSKVGSMIDSMMDFESSIEKELEASMLLGRSINLNKARQMAFNGDIKGAMEETLKQVGTLEDFNKMNMFQKKAIADAAGQTVADLENTLVTQKEINKLGHEQQEEYKELVKHIQEGKKLNGEQLLDQQRQQVAMDDLMNSLKAIGTSLSRVILPIIHAIEPVVKFIADKIAMIPDFLNKIQSNSDGVLASFWNWVVAIGAAVVAFKGIQLAIFGLKKLAGGFNLSKMFSFGGKTGIESVASKGNIITKGLKSMGDGLKGAAKGIGSGIKSLFGAFDKINPASILKFAAISLILIGALYGLGFALKQFNDVEWGAVAMGMLSLAALAGIAILLGSVSPGILIGAAAILVLAGALYVVGLALQEVGKALPTFSEFIENMASIGAGLITAAVGISALAFALGAFSLALVGNSIASFFSSDPVGQFERFAAIADKLDVAASAVERLKNSIAGFSDVDSDIKVLSNIEDATGELNGNISNTFEGSVSNENDSVVEEIKRSNTMLEEKIEKISIAISNMKVSIDGKIAGKIISNTIPSVSRT